MRYTYYQCDDCNDSESVHGASVEIATRKARESGWRVAVNGLALCAKCVAAEEGEDGKTNVS